MKNSLADSANGRSGLDTLAQSGTGSHSLIRPIGTIVRGEGTEITKTRQLQGWAKKKLICQTIMLQLIDHAKEKGAWDRVKSYWNTYYCYSRIISSGNRLYGNFCKNRFCPVCNGIRKAELINKYYPELRTWEEPYFLTLTVKSPKANELRRCMDDMQRILRRIIGKHKRQCQRQRGMKLLGIHSMECNFNPITRTYNPHFHLIVKSEVVAETIRQEWMAEGQKFFGKYAISDKAQKSEKVRNLEECLVEVLKYTSKIFTSPDGEKQKRRNKASPLICIAAYDTIIAALKGRRVFDRFGFSLSPHKKAESKIRLLKEHKDWNYLMEYYDWIEIEGVLTLTGYQKTSELERLLSEKINSSLC